MNEVAEAIANSIAELPDGLFLILLLPVLLSVPLHMCKILCGVANGHSRRRAVPETPYKRKDVSTAPIPCAIHNDCTDCGFYGTGYCWRVMNHE